MNPIVKKILLWGSAIGVSGGVIVAVLVFALDAYVGQVVDVKLESKLAAVPTTIGINAKLTTIEDGIADNATTIKEVHDSQERFELLFLEYLQNEANR